MPALFVLLTLAAPPASKAPAFLAPVSAGTQALLPLEHAPALFAYVS
jgi:hypothetical protein